MEDGKDIHLLACLKNLFYGEKETRSIRKEGCKLSRWWGQRSKNVGV